ncbi:hypothetical protein FKM82_014231 [Ascaphus truei]
MYLAAGFICVTILVISLPLIWKKKICKMKLWLSKRKGFTLYKFSPKKRITLFKYKEESKEKRLLHGQSINPSCDVTLEPESYGRTEHVLKNTERQTEDKAEMHGRDHLNNRIEKIYIMKADTVLVGSISETPNRQVSVLIDCETNSNNCKDNTQLATHYPEQESSKVPVNEVMLSVEEEGKRDSHTKSDTANQCAKDRN